MGRGAEKEEEEEEEEEGGYYFISQTIFSLLSKLKSINVTTIKLTTLILNTI